MPKSSTPPLTITGASENNLKNIDVSIKHDELTVITGLSGSGKSTLAFDTIYAEGQRRYVETFSPYTRQFLDKVKKPEISSCKNIRPALAIQQKTKILSSRSTVGSLTDVNDYLAILWSNLAVPYSKNNTELKKHSGSAAISSILKLNLEKFAICTPIIFPDKKQYVEIERERLITLGLTRFYKDNFDDLEEIENYKFQPGDVIYALIDRFKAQNNIQKRLLDAATQSYQLSKGICALVSDAKLIKLYTEFYAEETLDLKDLSAVIPNPKPGLFSFSSPIGACSECKGFGAVLKPDVEKIISNPQLSISEGAIECWEGPSSKTLKRKLINFCKDNNIDPNKSWSKLSEKAKSLIFESKVTGFKGINHWFKHIERKVYKAHVRIFLSKYRSQFTCTECHGSRLKKESLQFKLNGINISEAQNLEIKDLLSWYQSVDFNFDSIELDAVTKALSARLNYLNDLGLSYLTLNRAARTLSGGETQRVNLAAAIGSDLVSTQFVLDEPSVGLHPRDTERLLSSILDLRNKGNSVLMVEHDLDCISAADKIINLGPKTGKTGGQILNKATPLKPSKTASGKKSLDKDTKYIDIKNAKTRNLKSITTKIPLNHLVVLSGVSGSGKSTLVQEVILKGFESYSSPARTLDIAKVTGYENIDQVLLIDQSGLVKSPRANIATYSGIWDAIRSELAKTEQAENKSLSKSSFSFNVDGGRCPECKGAGFIKEDMQFLNDVYLRCPICLGTRFQQSILEIKYLDKNVDDWLATTIEECSQLIDLKDVNQACETLIKLGLGHLTLGHSLSELSGGEAQRLKLVPFIQKSEKKKSLLIFDEPTTGLHLDDVKNLILVFHELIDRGHSVVCIEHNQEVILAADWIIDLGPDGGKDGGEIVLNGSAYDFLKSKNKKSQTAKYLQEYVTDKNKQTRKNQKKTSSENLIIKGAKEHNLKNIDLNIPHNQLVAITGVSGSGKSTIAKDIIYSEGQRKYLDCLSPYARQFIKGMTKPDVAEIKNLRPTICVHQHTFKPGKLSTVGTMSEIYNYLRLLYSKVGTQFCTKHQDQEVSSLSHKEMAQKLLDFEGQTIRLLAPIVKAKKGHHRAIFVRARKAEIPEVRVDGKFGSIADFEEGLDRHKVHNIDFVWAKIVPNRIPFDLLEEAVEEVMSLSGGNLIVNVKNQDKTFSQIRACPQCGTGYFKPDPEDLSFNSKRGRCIKCNGTGTTATGLCRNCQGSRINKIGQNIRVLDKNIYQLSEFNAEEMKNFLSSIKWKDEDQQIITTVFEEIITRLDRLINLGIDYIPLSRSCHQLSKGELQRLRLANAMGSPLSGTIYIFDEPSAGLHPDDNKKVMSELISIKDNTNSVFLIEHDEESINQAEHIIEVGPGGGNTGGEITFNDSAKKYKFPKTPIIENKVELVHKNKFLSLKQATLNNINNLNLKIPLGQLVCFAGVSGAGKSTLVNSIILDALMNKKSKYTELTSDLDIDRVLVVDQSPIGKNSRSTPASYLKIWDEIRKLFAQTIEAKSRGWQAGFFSYNSGDGRCPECRGLGKIKLEMSFLADAYVQCEYCNGLRFTDEALTAKFLNLNVAEVLNLTFDEAQKIFANNYKIHKTLKSACSLGLGYLTLGQSSATLSGGESQRIKLTQELSAKPRGHTLYILDEPTVGLHKKDVAMLIKVLKDLVARGDSVFVIEHDEFLLQHSDYLIELGPGAGDAGGKVLFKGGIKDLAGKQTPWANRLVNRRQ